MKNWSLCSLTKAKCPLYNPLPLSTDFQDMQSTDTYLAFNFLKIDFPKNFGTIIPDYVNPGRGEGGEKTNYNEWLGQTLGLNSPILSFHWPLTRTLLIAHWPTGIPKVTFIVCCTLLTPDPVCFPSSPPPINSAWFCFLWPSLDPQYDQANTSLCRTLCEIATFLGSLSASHSLKSFSWENFFNKSLAHGTSC